jgi:hypothetical protein
MNIKDIKNSDEHLNQILGFKESMEPAIKWFQENCHHHQNIIIGIDGVKVVSTDMAYPVKIPD